MCPECGREFPPPQSELDDTASGEGILSGEITDTDYDVSDIAFSVHTKRGADESTPKTMRIEYQVGWNQWVSEWVCPEHTGWARQKFEKWWNERSMYPPPVNAHQAVVLAEDGALAKTKSITVRCVSGEKFDRVIRYEVGDKPEYYPEPGWNDDDDEKSEDHGSVMAGTDWHEDDIPF